MPPRGRRGPFLLSSTLEAAGLWPKPKNAASAATSPRNPQPPTSVPAPPTMMTPSFALGNRSKPHFGVTAQVAGKA